jgi:hypothetical protein
MAASGQRRIPELGAKEGGTRAPCRWRNSSLSRAPAGLPAFRFARYRNDIDRKRPLSRHWVCVGEVAAKPADHHAGGVGVGSAGLAGRVRESVVGGGSVQLGDVLLGDDGGEMC